MDFLTVQSRRIEYECLSANKPEANSPTIVMLHEGLGSNAMWRDFPQQVADSTGSEVVVYSRYGYGKSDAIETGYSPDFMHKEALESLPDLLDQLNIQKPILFGHSDGGSIALIHAGGTNRDLSGVIVMAPHIMVEKITVTQITAAKDAYLNCNLREKIAKYHDNVDSLFRAWTDIWLHPDFLQWNIEDYLPVITCPVLAIQGVDDEYGTMEHLDIISRKVKDVDLVKLSNCKHSPHKDQPQAVLNAVAAFVLKLKAATV